MTTPATPNEVTAMREAAGLSIPELAEKLGCDRTYLWRVEQGHRSPSSYFLAHLAAVLSGVGAAS